MLWRCVSCAQNENNLTIWYSVWLSIWSVVFLSVWKRREAELAFLWGSEGFEASEQPRTQFKGRSRRASVSQPGCHCIVALTPTGCVSQVSSKLMRRQSVRSWCTAAQPFATWSR